MHRESWKVRDVIWGDVFLTAEDRRILDTFEMQRLRGIKQLDFAFLVYPGAEHTRFQHSLGVRACVDRIISASKLPVDEEELRLVRVAALLHDAATPVFSHVVSDFFRRFYPDIIPPHEKFVGEVLEGVCYEKYIERHPEAEGEVPSLKEALQEEGYSRSDRRKIVRIITGEFKPKYIAQLVNGALDADRLDYLKRDAYYTGVPQSYDDRIFSSFNVGEGDELTLKVKHDAIGAAVSVLESRFWMMQKVYLHLTVLAANCLALEMLVKALGDYDFYELFFLDDAEILNQFIRSEVEEVRVLACRMRYRKLPKKAYVAHLKELPEKVSKAALGMINYHELQDEIANEAKAINPRLEIDEKDIFLYLPRDYYKGAEEVRVGDATLEEYDPSIVQTLKARYESLMQVCVYVSNNGYVKTVNDACVRLFGVKSDYDPNTRRPPLRKKGSVDEEILRFLKKVRDGANYALKALRTLVEVAEACSRDKLSEMMGVEATTVSTYLQQIYRLQKMLRQPVLLRMREGRKILWEVNPNLREGLRRGLRMVERGK
ncbi:MAG: HD domain-containing protein [Candidatus Freyarchaeota archaeon]